MPATRVDDPHPDPLPGGEGVTTRKGDPHPSSLPAGEGPASRAALFNWPFIFERPGWRRGRGPSLRVEEGEAFLIVLDFRELIPPVHVDGPFQA